MCNEVDARPGGDQARASISAAISKQIERNESDIVVADPFTGEVKKSVHSIYPNVSGVLTTAGGLVFTGFVDGTFVAYDDTTPRASCGRSMSGPASTRRR